MSQFWDWFNERKDELGNRAETFTKMFEYLDKFNRPVEIIETGCVRKAEFQGDGQSTVLFDHYVRDRGGKVYSVDINPKHTEIARQLTNGQVTIHTGDSVEYLKELATNGHSPDLVYLDSLDYLESDPFHAALHCGNEFHALRPVLRPDTLVVCDDTPSVFSSGAIATVEYFGKGMFIATHAKAVGADILFNNWQIGWVHMTGSPARTTDEDVEQLIGRARSHVEANHATEAERCYRAVIHKTRPPKSGIDRVARGEACAFYARTAAIAGQYGTATDWYRDAIMADPRAVDYRLELVVRAYRPQLHWQLAEQECLHSISIEPENANAWRLLGDVRMTLCNVKGCIEAYDRQMELNPDHPAPLLDRCVIALDTGDYDTVRKLVQRVLNSDRRADGLHVLAMIENRAGNHEKAIEYFDQAIAAECNNLATAHWNKSLSLHAIGHYREGWAEHEWRRKQLDNPALSIAFQRFTRPLWEGQPPPAKIHVHCEAGIGDNIIFSRFLNHFVEQGYQVRYETHDELVGLMARSFPDVEVVKRAPDYPGAVGIHNFDYHLPTSTLPFLMETEVDTVPWNGPYLKPDPVKVEEYRKILPKRGKKIGLCWSSGIREYGVWLMEYGKRKSMHYDQLTPLIREIDRNGAIPINLQVGPERAQARGLIDDLLPEKPDWDDTAALIANLDLVITVDTSVAHCAAALGKETWVMMQRDGATWHFMCWRESASWNEKSPWYPNVRLFRQHEFNKPHYWDEVVQDVIGALDG